MFYSSPTTCTSLPCHLHLIVLLDIILFIIFYWFWIIVSASQYYIHLNCIRLITVLFVTLLTALFFPIQIIRSLITQHFCYRWSFLQEKLYLSNIMASLFYFLCDKSELDMAFGERGNMEPTMSRLRIPVQLMT